MYVNFKCTIWERIKIPESIEKEFTERIKSSKILSADEAFGAFGKKADDNYELLIDTSVQMRPEENAGESTIEIQDGENILWDNAIKQEIK